MLVAQKAAAKDEPSVEDMFEVGCVATILQLLKLPDGTVRYVRHLELHSGHLPAAAYAAYVAFCRRINQADKAQLVLLKTEG